jgi:hypothetical protein
MVGANRNTLTAGLTLLGIDHGTAIDDINGIKGTGTCAGAETRTTISTGLASAAGSQSQTVTIVITEILILEVRLITASGALYEGYQADGFGSFHAQSRTYTIHTGLTAYWAGSNGCFAIRDSFCKTVTAGIAASAAVITGKALTNGIYTLIGGNRKYLSGDAQENTDNKANTGHDTGGDQDSENLFCTHYRKPPLRK